MGYGSPSRTVGTRTSHKMKCKGCKNSYKSWNKKKNRKKKNRKKKKEERRTSTRSNVCVCDAEKEGVGHGSLWREWRWRWWGWSWGTMKIARATTRTIASSINYPLVICKARPTQFLPLTDLEIWPRYQNSQFTLLKFYPILESWPKLNHTM